MVYEILQESSNMSDVENPEDIVNLFISKIESRELDAALEHVSDDCYYDNVPIGDMNGKEDIAATPKFTLEECGFFPEEPSGKC